MQCSAKTAEEFERLVVKKCKARTRNCGRGGVLLYDPGPDVITFVIGRKTRNTQLTPQHYEVCDVGDEIHVQVLQYLNREQYGNQCKQEQHEMGHRRTCIAGTKRCTCLPSPPRRADISNILAHFLRILHGSLGLRNYRNTR